MKHERRFFFLQERPAYASESPGELLDPGAILGTIVTQALGLGLASSLVEGTRVFRVRAQTGPGPFRTALEFGPPPSDEAIQANRMSPPGVVMTYVSEDEETALRETADDDGTYAIGTFEFARSVTLLDLTRVPEVPSIFTWIALGCAMRSSSCENSPRRYRSRSRATTGSTSSTCRPRS